MNINQLSPAQQLEALLNKPITSKEESHAFIQGLHDLDRLFHFDDSPSAIIAGRTGLPLWTPEECPLVEARVQEAFSFGDPHAYCCFISNPPKYAEEFPTFGMLDVELPDGFEDTSWVNDAMPSFQNSLDKEYVRVAIDFLDPELRDMGPDEARFYGSRVDAETGNDIDVFSSDDWAEMTAWLLKAIETSIATQASTNFVR